jgi:hypothetical protein
VSCDKSDKTDNKSHGKSNGGKKFHVTFGGKNNHQWAAYNKGNSSIHINGKCGPVIHVKRGSTYHFVVNQNGGNHTFVFTNSPAGNVNGTSPNPLKGCHAVSNGTCVLKCDNNVPRYFYYQCTKCTCEGGLVICHDA